MFEEQPDFGSKKIAQIEADNINLNVDLLADALPDIHQEVDDGLQKVTELLDGFTDIRNDYERDNQAALAEPIAKQFWNPYIVSLAAKTCGAHTLDQHRRKNLWFPHHLYVKHKCVKRIQPVEVEQRLTSIRFAGGYLTIKALRSLK
jgi:hypothetical protein